MLVLAPDPRLGIAPERVARVRTLLDEAGTAGAGVPGVVVALPGGPDGILDAVVLRPDGVLGLAPLGLDEHAVVRETVTAGGSPGTPPAGTARPATSPAGLPSATPTGPLAPAADELDRLLGLPDSPCSAPRRVLDTLPADGPVPHAGGSAGAHAATLAALTASVGSFRVIDADDLRRLLAAFRLGDHVPEPARLAEAGFLDADTPAAHAGVAPQTRPVPVADEPPAGPGAPAHRDGAGRPALPPTGQLPAGDGADPTPAVSPDGGSRPDTGAPEGIGGLLGPSVRSGRGRDRVPHARYGGVLPDWVWGWRGLTVAAVAAFLVALGLAVLVGRAATPDAPEPDPSAVRVVDGVTFVRRVATSDVSCEGHAYGQAAAFLRERGCLHLDRSLWTGTAEGRQVVVAVSTVQMTDTTTAGAFRSLIDTNGTGNISDLLREQRGYPGAPPALTAAGYASAQLGDRVVIAEADGVDPSFTDGDTLDRISGAGLALR